MPHMANLPWLQTSTFIFIIFLLLLCTNNMKTSFNFPLKNSQKYFFYKNEWKW